MVKQLVLKNLFKALGGLCFSVKRLVRSSAYCLLQATILVSLFPSRVMLGALETKMRELKTLTSTLIILDITKTKSKCPSCILSVTHKRTKNATAVSASPTSDRAHPK